MTREQSLESISQAATEAVRSGEYAAKHIEKLNEAIERWREGQGDA